MRVLLAVAIVLAVPASASAAPPPNDAPAGAVEFSSYTAANGAPVEQQGVVDLSEATADAGVPRCLGPGSFERTVWFKVPAATVGRLVKVEASSPSGGSSEVPDLALFVGAQTAEPQACDGAATGALTSSGALTDAWVPAGQEVLVQIGRGADQGERRVIASLRTTDAPPLPAPLGDLASDAPVLGLGAALSDLSLAGATLTAEDPAQPACPAPATVWRRTPVRPGVHRVVATGAGTVTVFTGPGPTADGARACANRSGARTALKVRVRRATTLWTRVGADAPVEGATARVSVRRPRGRLSIRRAVAGRRSVRVRLRARGQTIRRIRVRIRRAGAPPKAQTAAVRTLRAGRARTIRVPGALAPGRYRVIASGRDDRVRVGAVRILRVRS